jgi:hypothetical protein
MFKRVLLGIALVLGFTLPQRAEQAHAADWLAYGYVSPVAYNVVSPYGYYQYASYPYYPYAYVPYSYYPYRAYYASYPAVYAAAYVNYPSMYYSASYAPAYYTPAYPPANYPAAPAYALGANVIVNPPAVVAPAAQVPVKAGEAVEIDSKPAVPNTYESAPQADNRSDQPIAKEIPAESYEEPPAPPIAEGQNSDQR